MHVSNGVGVGAEPNVCNQLVVRVKIRLVAGGRRKIGYGNNLAQKYQTDQNQENVQVVFEHGPIIWLIREKCFGCCLTLVWRQ